MINNKFELEIEDSLKPIDIKVLTWSEFKAQTYEEPKWIVEGLVPEKGLVAIAGSPESCKSLFSNYLAATVARGNTLFDLYKTIQVPVLLIDQENLEPWLQKRLSDFIEQDDIPLHIYPKQEWVFNVDDQCVFDEVLKYIDKHKIGLVIIDTLRFIHNKDENSSTEMKPVFDRLRQLTEETAVIFIHHNKKTDKFSRRRVDGEDMMGSIIIRGCVDSQLTLTKLSDVAESVTKIKVTQTKSRYTRPIPSFALTLEETDTGLGFVYQGVVEEDKLKKDEAKEAVLSLLEQTLTRQEIIDQVIQAKTCSKRTVESALSELIKEKKVTRSTTKPFYYSLLKEEQLSVPQFADTHIDYGVAESLSQANKTSDQLTDGELLDIFPGATIEGVPRA
ncbi:MAG: hypothetical protein A3D24_02275 [Candidatus Blackburnbacteria bacterium RIFCSPHIGHO2_02_FULL_39_13]|uniref:AAA+ ATPase domain-containing protein n=1 Tax=Candidatus Blackburnbacteria bacterium RIFCSPLOWO2_01_FULL_40_20 TaxID=1797519 RepID=A0A1G1VAW5_9BACT|nr:MAG: hypothetical protein A2694_02905 [Candidatus Blackburnbacteria bacterium RIFCSPHIGHO2_01_FULL_40_17]OGY09509.1 MAG: hypothetical protein A3D24_02275 [Candidatus Blackburnbacteria bacterium RIFCSPHIGHO2_02_FULL_39_13]OGY12523.1 MAG: hypothetical protein A3A77_00945 [Candidatus Blackburnbacteria bacterium RIFCSPLOWO2_01_FULL_40_20]OGY15130.1 MAG: hypothetical protein A3I52_00060 [Candidatus Blackburnbacteria bacterium RIFCSPLOWO2_02_FULL_40_10]HBL51667.1 hypothetical protein [Candidatus B